MDRRRSPADDPPDSEPDAASDLDPRTHPIVARRLVRCFGENRAVDGIDLSVAEGEIFGFLGPNGAGKSTTVRVLVTLLRPTSGEAFVAGHDVVSQADLVRRDIGVALQDAAIDPLMTGRELLRLQAVLHGIGRRESNERSERLLEQVGLTDAADRLVGGYSGGMRRRLDLALALMHEPKVLFLDEPTTGLDPMSRINLWDELRRLNTELGTTVLLTTQYLEEADELAHRVAIIDRGRIVRDGSPAALKDEIGCPTLMLDIDDGDVPRVTELLAPFGELRPARSGRVAVGLEGGTAAMTAVARALDDAGIVIHHLELDEPSLDDVFADATGRRLEGAGVEPDGMSG
jgi:ABC-2 type transport system ATP-binding protein